MGVHIPGLQRRLPLRWRPSKNNNPRQYCGDHQFGAGRTLVKATVHARSRGSYSALT